MAAIRIRMKYVYLFLFLFIQCIILSGCEKLLSIPDPSYSITTNTVFNSDKQASAAIAGVYSVMINGNTTSFGSHSALEGFACGLSTIAGSQSSDDFSVSTYFSSAFYSTNKLTTAVASYSLSIWKSAFESVYGANAILEGVSVSKSFTLSDSARRQLEGEAKFLRAFSYFYLTNFFGDVPLVLTTDISKIAMMARTPRDLVYKQIIKDLLDAKMLLPEGYQVSNDRRVRPNKWAAAALLARVYLYTKDYNNAVIQSSEVIAINTQYKLIKELDQVFSTTSKEAIWQLMQSNTISNLGNGTAEGAELLPFPIKTGIIKYPVSAQLLAAFETGDKRKDAWIDSSTQMYEGGGSAGVGYYSKKYKTGAHNRELGGQHSEYYMVLRLAEQYLIRAEAQANGAAGGPSAAVTDLNEIRFRADLPNLPDNISVPDLLLAIEHEWRVEFFSEWAHRWFNLKRTGRATTVLGNISFKQPWLGDYQLLYPIPAQEIMANPNLIQNQDY